MSSILLDSYKRLIETGTPPGAYAGLLRVPAGRYEMPLPWWGRKRGGPRAMIDVVPYAVGGITIVYRSRRQDLLFTVDENGKIKLGFSFSNTRPLHWIALSEEELYAHASELLRFFSTEMRNV